MAYREEVPWVGGNVKLHGKEVGVQAMKTSWRVGDGDRFSG